MTSAAAIGAVRAKTLGEVRYRLGALETHRLVVSRSDEAAVPLRRVYLITGEGAQKVLWPECRL